VAYDALAESIKLIESRTIVGPTRLSRRRRFIPLAVDVDGDVAVTVFLRRGVAVHELETHDLLREHGHWRLLGGGGASDCLDELARPWSNDERGYFGRVSGGTWIDLNSDLALGGGRLPLQSTWLDLATEVAEVECNRRTVPVPWHHHVALVWRGRTSPQATLRAADGTVLARLDLD
jgi:hypothetical protein